MKILVVGGGGREAVICQKLKESDNIDLYCAPGNAGIAEYAQLVDIKATDIEALLKFSKQEAFDLVVVAPDDPLALGLVDKLEAEGIKAFGPSAAAARIESSKTFAKQIMKRAFVPTASYEEFTDSIEALKYIESLNYPLVIKADGLALGKGVFICQHKHEAEEAIKTLMLDQSMGEAGKKILIEEFLEGEEMSVLVFTDGENYSLMPSSRDHKRAYDGDRGPNTGGMGVISPGRDLTDEEIAVIKYDILEPTLKEMRKENCRFKGVLYLGLMLTDKGPKVIEYNARFGDPEAQTVLPMLKTKLLDIFLAISNESLDEIHLEWDIKAACCVVLCSGGYPLTYTKGYTISGLKELGTEDVFIYHAATKLSADGQEFLSNGGRVLNVVALADTRELAIKKAYEEVQKISFTDMFFRKDIGL